MKLFPKLALAFFVLFISVFESKAQCPPASSQFVHVVQKGESLYRISKKYYLSVEEIASMNNIDPKAPIAICQELIISNAHFSENTNTSTSSTSGSSSSTSVVKPQGSDEHIVKQGETIAGIAYAYGYTEERFRRFNGLSANQQAMAGLTLKTSDCVCPSYDSGSNPEVTDTGRENREDEWNIPNTETRTYDPPSRTGSDGRYSGFEENPFGEEETTYYDWEPKRDAPTSYERNERKIENNTPPATSQPTTRQTSPSRAFLPADEKLAEKKTSGNTSSSNNSSTFPTKDAARYMTAEEIEMVKEINLVRSNPAGYIPYIEEYKNKIAEGRAFGSVETCNELISELKRTAKLPILSPTECIYAAAKKHGQDQRPTGDVDHIGTDGSYPWDRVKRECPSMIDGGENLVAGPSSVRDCVILLLVDDGIPNRGHRRTLLKSDWKYVACYKVGQVGNMPNNWVQKFGR